MKKINFIIMAIIAIGMSLSITSCRTYHEDKYIDVKPNQTAFVIPLEMGTANQKQLKSLEFLKQHQIAAKRIQIPTVWHSKGYMWFSGEFIPTVAVILVDRTPITREWTSVEGTGTSGKNQAVVVESSNSIGFRINITCTASILEETTATYQYWYGGKTLGEVMDENVRSYIQENLSTNFGRRELAACQNDRSAVFKVMKDSTIAFFERRGITIDNIGSAGEFSYLNEEIQTAINTEFVAKKKRDAAVNEVAAAQLYAQASEAIKAQKQLDADITVKLAMAEAIKEGKLPMPATLVVGSGMSMFDIWGIKNMGSK